VEIIRNDDGTLLVPVEPERTHVAEGEEPDEVEAPAEPTTRLLHPGEGGYDEALAEWDLQQHGGETAVSTADGREQAMGLVHALAEDPDRSAAEVVAELDDPEASAEALRHVLVGGVHSVEDFASEVVANEGGEEIPAHQATKIIGEVLAELD
jgi:antirestriction protein